MSRFTVALLFVVLAQVAYSQIQLIDGEVAGEHLVIRAKRAEVEGSGEAVIEGSGQAASVIEGSGEGSGAEPAAAAAETPSTESTNLLSETKEAKPVEEIAA